MANFSLVEIADLCGVNYTGENPGVAGIAIDSRTLKPGDVFVALKGEKFDGHDFINEAFNNGAVAAIVSRENPSVAFPQFIVTDTIKTLGYIASHCRQNAKIPLIAITGSNGKTTTKNLTASILQSAFGSDKALFSTGGFNNHIGLPLTLTRLDDKHASAVVEIGMNHFGELTYLSDIANPDIVVITNAGPSHLEGVGDVAGVAKAKAEAFHGMSLQGTAVLNKDSPFFDFWVSQLEGRRVVSFGINSDADFKAADIQLISGACFTLHSPDGQISIKLQLLGRHNVINTLAAAAACWVLGIELAVIKKGVESVKPIAGRLCEHHFSNGLRIIDDAYNANPLSVSAAIDTLVLYDTTTILVLGDMKELGAEAEKLHYEIGQHAKAAGISQLFAVGTLVKSACEGFGEGAQYAPDHDALVELVTPWLKENTSVLVKGSLSMRMQDVVSALLSRV